MQKLPYKRIGEKVKLAREEIGLAQEAMSQKLGYRDRLCLYRIEIGQKSPYRKLQKIARITKRPVSWFLDEDKEMDALIWKAQQYDALVEQLQRLPLLRFPRHYSEMDSQELENELTRFGVAASDFQKLFKSLPH